MEIQGGRLKGPYSNNVIAFSLRAISARYGVDEANRAIHDMKLEPLGWSPQSGEEPYIVPRVNPRDLVDPLDRIEREG